MGRKGDIDGGVEAENGRGVNDGGASFVHPEVVEGDGGPGKDR